MTQTLRESVHQKMGVLLDALETHLGGLPADVVDSAAQLHAALAGPGSDALDLRPKSLELVNDAALHQKAVAEAKARLQASVAAQADTIAKLPSSTLQAAADYDAQTNAHRVAVHDAYDNGVDDGREQQRVADALWWHEASLWAALRRWWQAR